MVAYSSNTNTSTTTWTTWVTTSASNTATSTTTSAVVWNNWTSRATTTTNNSITWGNWTTEKLYHNTPWAEWVTDHDNKIITPRKLTLEEERKRQELHRIEQERIAAFEFKKKTAKEKATNLLVELIGKQHKSALLEHRKLLVEGSKGGLFLINTDGGHIKKIDSKKLNAINYCIHLKDKYAFPEMDNVIALVLELQNDEEFVVKKANKHLTEPINDLNVLIKDIPRLALQ